MLLLNLIPLINVTFSTPTSVYAHNHSVMSEIAMFQQELQDGSSWRLLFADEFRLILAVFRYLEIIRELRDGRARWL